MGASPDPATCAYSKSKVLFRSLGAAVRRGDRGDAAIADESQLPVCPECKGTMAPNCLLFDEEYSDHSSYQFDKAKKWLKEADVICFVGTSFAVQITNIAFCCAADRAPPATVFNFNIEDNAPRDKVGRVYFHPVTGPCEETLQQLLDKLF